MSSAFFLYTPAGFHSAETDKPVPQAKFVEKFSRGPAWSVMYRSETLALSAFLSAVADQEWAELHWSS